MTLQVVLLGTGSPSPSLTRSHPAALVQWEADGERSQVLVDCGDGTVSRLLAAGVALPTVEHVAFTHLHWDHVLGYPALVWGSWSHGRSRLRVFGPPGTEAMHRQLVEDFYRNQAEWAIDVGYERAGWDDLEVTEVADGWSAELDGCRIEARSVVHPPMASFGYRFSHRGASIVVSGDVARCGELIELARDADVLVVDACAAPPPPQASPRRRALIERLHTFHASPQDCIDMAAEAGVSRVVLTHHLPEAAVEVDTSAYGGQVIVGNDLDVIAAPARS